MPAEELPREADVDKVNSSLNEGLETCRSVVANYRDLLKGEADKGRKPDEAPEAAAD